MQIVIEIMEVAPPLKDVIATEAAFALGRAPAAAIATTALAFGRLRTLLRAIGCNTLPARCGRDRLPLGPSGPCVTYTTFSSSEYSSSW